MSFVHLHAHTNFSFGDGACRIPELVAAAAGMGMPALAATDHEGLYGAVRFYQACKEAGIKPIVGVELTVEPAVEPRSPGPSRSRRRRAGSRRPGRHRRAAGAAAAGAQASASDPSPPLAAAHHARRPHPALTARPRCRRRPPTPPAPAATTWCCSPATTPAGATSAASSAPPTSSTQASRRWPGSPRSPSTRPPRRAQRLPARRGLVAARWPATSAGARAAASVFREHLRRGRLLHRAAARAAARLGRHAARARPPRPRAAPAHGGHQQRALHGQGRRAACTTCSPPRPPTSRCPTRWGARTPSCTSRVPAQMRRLFQRYPRGLRQRRPHRRPLQPRPRPRAAPLPRLPAAARRDRLLAALEALLPGRRGALPAAHRRGHRAPGARAQGHRGAGLRRVLPGRARHRRVRARPRHLLLGPRLGRQQHRQLRAAHHRRRPHRARAALRALPQPGAPRDAGRGHRLLLGAPRRGHPVHLRALRPRQGGHGRHRQHRARALGGAHRQPRLRLHARTRSTGSRARCPGAAPPSSARCSPNAPSSPTTSSSTRTTAAWCDVAERLSGFPAHLGTHLGGFILSRDPLTDRVPLQWAAKGVVVAQFDKDDVETLGLVKMDILALKMHSAIAEAVRRIEARTGEHDQRLGAAARRPRGLQAASASARTVGLFQLESSGQRNLATRLQERDFEDVIAAISLFRPGPLQAEMIGPFITAAARARSRRRAAPRHGARPAPHLRRHRLPGAGHRGGRRRRRLQPGRGRPAAPRHDARALHGGDGRDRPHLRRRRRSARGVEQATAEEVFRQLRGFAAYGFNKAHAACFAIVCNACAWLKAHYPAEFYCGILNNQPMGFYSPRVVLNDARRFGLRGAAAGHQPQRRVVRGRGRGAGAARGARRTSKR